MAGEIQELRDRVEFLEPMCAATRRDAEESRAANASIRKERDEAVAKRDEAVAKRDMYRSVAARVPQPEAMVAQRDARIARMRQDLDHLVKVARRYVTGKVVYPAGPNEPPSEQKARRQGEEMGRGRGKGRRRRGRGAPACRKSRAAARATGAPASPTGPRTRHSTGLPAGRTTAS